MTDEEIFHKFYESAEHLFPPEHRVRAEDWLIKAAGSLQAIEEIEAEASA
jgi:hypothetical protein